MSSYLLLISAAFAAGLVNSVAGGGSFLTFPALVFTGVPSIVANASSTLALLPGSLASGWAYREDLRKSTGLPFVPLLIASIAGGIAGALLLLYTPQRTFDSAIPWLLLASTLLFTFGPGLSPLLREKFHIGAGTIITVQFFVAIYGGYFGGAVGIVMLAAWSVFGLSDIHVINANRSILVAAMNGVAVALFIAAGKIWWPQTIAMLVAAVVGGYIGARMAKRIEQRYLRAGISVVSAAITIVFFARHR